jgi:hypothetical protein
LICTKFSPTITKVRVDIPFKFGTLAERTDKQPGPPGTQQTGGGYRLIARSSLSVEASPQR